MLISTVRILNAQNIITHTFCGNKRVQVTYKFNFLKKILYYTRTLLGLYIQRQVL